MYSDLRVKAQMAWDDDWFIETVEWADGDEQAQAHHTVEVLADGVVIRDVMNEDLEITRHVVKTREYVAEVDR